jgi:hypothetical protein
VPPSGASRRASVKPSAAGARFSIAGPALAAAMTEAAAAEAAAAPLPRRPLPNSRKSVGGAALRVTLPGTHMTQFCMVACFLDVNIHQGLASRWKQEE